MNEHLTSVDVQTAFRLRLQQMAANALTLVCYSVATASFPKHRGIFLGSVVFTVAAGWYSLFCRKRLVGAPVPTHRQRRILFTCRAGPMVLMLLLVLAIAGLNIASSKIKPGEGFALLYWIFTFCAATAVVHYYGLFKVQDGTHPEAKLSAGSKDIQGNRRALH